MNFDTANALATLGATAVFVLIFYGESWLTPRFGPEATRRIVSCSVGMAVAYVFVHLLPELAATTKEFVELHAEGELPFAHLRIYMAALVGFMLFYGLENMVQWSRLAPAESEAAEERDENVHVRILTASYALYVFVVCYAMAHEIRAGDGELALYAFAMGLHFLGFAYGLRRDNEVTYRRWGRHVLAAAGVLGWAVALVVPLPESLAYTLLGFVAGVLIMDTVTSELGGQAKGRFAAFLAGGAVYTAVLVLFAG